MSIVLSREEVRRKRRKLKLNFDADDPLRALHIANELRKRFGEDRVLMRRSSSRRGWHFWVKGDFSKEEILKMREELNDCLGRLRADKVRAKMGMRIGILFYYKNKKYAEPWRKLDMKEILKDLIFVEVKLK